MTSPSDVPTARPLAHPHCRRTALCATRARQQLGSISAYARFLTVTNVPSEVVRELTGGAGLPGGLLILPDGV